MTTVVTLMAKKLRVKDTISKAQIMYPQVIFQFLSGSLFCDLLPGRPSEASVEPLPS